MQNSKIMRLMEICGRQGSLLTISMVNTAPTPSIKKFGRKLKSMLRPRCRAFKISSTIGKIALSSLDMILWLMKI